MNASEREPAINVFGLMPPKPIEVVVVARPDDIVSSAGWQERNEVATSLSWSSRAADAKERGLRSSWKRVIVDGVHRMSEDRGERSRLPIVFLDVNVPSQAPSRERRPRLHRNAQNNQRVQRREESHLG